jgi:hypothetical protein
MNAIGVLHLLIYLFMILAHFSFNLYILWIHIIFSCVILLHWKLNDNKCFLTELEASLRHVSVKETLSSKLFSPLIEPYDDHTVVAGTVIGLLVSVLKFSVVIGLLRIAPDDSQ